MRIWMAAYQGFWMPVANSSFWSYTVMSTNVVNLLYYYICAGLITCSWDLLRVQRSATTCYLVSPFDPPFLILHDWAKGDVCWSLCYFIVPMQKSNGKVNKTRCLGRFSWRCIGVEGWCVPKKLPLKDWFSADWMCWQNLLLLLPVRQRRRFLPPLPIFMSNTCLYAIAIAFAGE